MALKGNTIAVLVEQMFNDQEFWYPYYRLQEAEADVIVVGSGSADAYTGKAGTNIRVDKNAKDIKADTLDGIVIPGGYAPDYMRRYPSMVNLVKTVFLSGKLVAAICHAGWMLSSAGILTGKKMTSYFAIRDDMVHAGANWVDQAVCIDGNLITSRKPDDLPSFMKEIIKFLEG